MKKLFRTRDTMEKAKIINLYLAGLPWPYLRERFGLSNAGLHSILEQFNVPRRGGRSTYQETPTP